MGWFQGRMEFGPRALGGRSILADPRSEKMQKELNLKIKFRESFRPFAPAIIYEDLKDWFDLDYKSPYMLFVYEILDKHKVFENDIEKTLKLNKENRGVCSSVYLEKKYSHYIKLIENGNLVHGTIKEVLTQLPKIKKRIFQR